MLETLLRIIDALGWTLLHSLWQGALIAAVLWIVLAMLRDATASARYALTGSAFALMAIAPFATFLVVYESPVTVTMTMSAISLSTVPTVVTVAGGYALLEEWLPLMVLIWTIGVVLRGARVAAAWHRASNYLATGASAPDADLLRRFQRLVLELSPRLSPILLITDRVSVPSVVGWLKPVVLLPTSVLSGLSPIQLELILAHELAHIRRHDYIINLLQILLETLLYFHPAVHWMSRRMRDLREECCDEIVVASRGQRVIYARALAELESLRQRDSVVCMAATGGHLFDRITRIALPKRHRGHAPWATGLIISATAAILVTTGGHLLDQRRVADDGMGPTVARVSDYFAPAPRPEQITRERIAPLTLPTVAPAPTTSAGPVVITPRRAIESAPLALDLAAMQAEVSALAPAPLADAAPVLTGGVALATPAPVFPQSLQAQGRSAAIDFEFTVLGDGRITDLSYPDADPEDQRFRDAVTEAVADWRFEPFLLDGRPIAQRVRHTIEFSVEQTAASNVACGRITGSRLCRAPHTRTADYGVSVVFRGSR
jgi:bla regulator protein blaR1